MGQSFRQFSVARERGRLKQIIHHLERSCSLACHSQCHSQMHAHDSNASHQTLLPRRKQTKKLNFVRTKKQYGNVTIELLNGIMSHLTFEFDFKAETCDKKRLNKFRPKSNRPSVNAPWRTQTGIKVNPAEAWNAENAKRKKEKARTTLKQIWRQKKWRLKAQRGERKWGQYFACLLIFSSMKRYF